MRTQTRVRTVWFQDMGRHDAAIPIYRRALALRPDFPEAFAHLVHSMMVGEDLHNAPMAGLWNMTMHSMNGFTGCSRAHKTAQHDGW